MGDRCYMRVTCLKQDVAKFTELGFMHMEADPELPKDIAEMVDDEANYAHSGYMPTDVPYFGHHHEGGEYQGQVFCCDGEICCEVDAFNGDAYVRINVEGVVVDDLKAAEAYFACLTRTRKLLGFKD